MTDEKINHAIANAMGWTVAYDRLCEVGRDSKGDPELIPRAYMPNYAGDISHLHEAKLALLGTREQQALFGQALMEIVSYAASATARQQAEALLKTLEKWEAEA